MTSYLSREFDHRKFGSQPTFRSTTPHFLSIILDDTARDVKLGIPEDFVSKYGKDLSNSVTFRLPCGSEWEVGLTRYNGEVWFDKGWPDFSKFYSLGYNDLLVFGYEGKSRLQVSIFDKSTIEIEYPVKAPNIEESDEHDDSSVEILDDFPLYLRKAGETSRLPSPLLRMKNRTVSSGTAKINLSFEKSMKKKQTHGSKSGRKRKDHFPVKKEWGSTSSTKRFQKQTPEVHSKANVFKSHNCPFRMVIRPSYFNQNLLWLPSEFVRTHLMKQPSSVILCVPGGSKIWTVALNYQQKARRVSFNTGWIEFLRDNNLKVWDVCVFMLIDEIRLLFEVVTEAANCTMSSDTDDEEDNEDNVTELDDADDDEEADDDSIEILDHFPSFTKGKEKFALPSQLHKRRRTTSSTKAESTMKHVGGCSKTQKFLKQRPEVSKRIHPVMASIGRHLAFQRATAFKPPHPHFAVSIKPSYIRGNYLWLPTLFVHGNLIKRPSDAILKVSDGARWPVCFHYNKARATLQGGFAKFVRGNNLKVGDACVFVLTNNIKFLFDVFIFRTT
ncbi:putative transcription factor B3-Domain family [Rosa chinensis]|uniref:Putative transcription factor B3-Domain family n=1 Tax=Rosa chinensis TaxID=74649 RepID=A0A2P6PEL2_ROSCH|nr:B3 domain-containing transcription factor VRN1 [Rosa chinensis]PRQ20362.1 putative transcription factor B3-Domain family [Rosa chinensis]